MSQHEANKVIRVLSGNRLKFTVRVHKQDGSIVEWQADSKPSLDFNMQAQCLFLQSGEYPHNPIMKWEEGMVMLVEENPDAVKP